MTLHAVPFCAGPTGGDGAPHRIGWEGPATWGQRALSDGMRRYERQRWCRNTVSVRRVGGGTSLGGVLAWIGALVSRYEALRTEFSLDGAQLRQRVHAAGEVAVRVDEAGAGGAELVARLARRLPSARLDARGLLPVSFTVVTERGVPRWVVTALCFQNADGPSVRVLLDAPAAGQRPLQPREQHAEEGRDSARRRSDRAVAHWLAECAKAGVPFRPAAAQLRTAHARGGVVQAALTSAAAAARAERLALRCETTSTAVLMTAVAVAIGAATGQRRVPLQPFVSNRHLPGVAGYVGFLAQLCAMTAELDPRGSFAGTTGRVQRACLRAYRNAWWSPPELDAALLAAGLAPAEVLGAACTVNDLRGGWPGGTAMPPDPGRDFAIRSLPWWPYQGGRCAVAFTGGPERLTVALRLETAHVPAVLLPRLLVAVDGVLRTADADPAVPLAELLARAGDGGSAGDGAGDRAGDRTGVAQLA